MSGRRYRSTHGSWAIPYVDETSFVFAPARNGGTIALVAVATVAQVAGVCAAALVGAIQGLEPLAAVGFATSALPFVFCLWSMPVAARFSRLQVPRGRLVVRRVGEVFEAVVDEVASGPTTRRVLVHATVFGQTRLLLVLGEKVIELWRASSYAGGGHVDTRSDWTLERLAGGEGSARIGERESGRGALLPVLEGLRSVLALGPDDEKRVRGPAVPTSAWSALIALGAALSAMAYGVNAVVPRAVARTVTDPSATPLRVALGLGAGVLLVVVEGLSLRACLGRIARPIDEFVAGLLSDDASREAS
ncbi:MAG TPA: hypothetical protein VK762_32845 [Polyangiaceae bacterium]|jgi:hypothetical protein|nr:hypothetical protein [Polyangiaceae bacterium]